MGRKKLALIDPEKVRLFVPDGLQKFKLDLFERIASKTSGSIHGDVECLKQLPDDIVPIVGCSFELKELIAQWKLSGRTWIYWDRGYARRVFATWLPRGDGGGYYRWHINSYQMTAIRNAPDDRWRELNTTIKPWRHRGRHIVLALPSKPYSRFHGTEDWSAKVLARLRTLTDRPILLRDKTSKRPLAADLVNAHCLVTHGSNVAVEAAILGCPIFVDRESAAALIGITDITKIESPIYPERAPWLHSLAYSQFNEAELVDGTLWKLIV